MKKPRHLRKGDKVAIVSLSSGIIGEEYMAHQVELGVKRLEEFGLVPVFMENARKGIEYLANHPNARAADLKAAFCDEEIKGIICVIGGIDTCRLLPYLMEDEEFVEAVKRWPKLFTGFSDTTVNHLMFQRLGMISYYGPNFLCDLAELGPEMLPYTKDAFGWYFTDEEGLMIRSGEVWYEERTDFSAAAVGTERISHEETRGYDVLSGSGVVRGRLLGGCLESLYDLIAEGRREDEVEVCERYGIFPSLEEWRGKIAFIETCEEKPEPEVFRKELMALKKRGVFDVIAGLIVGKPQDEAYYEEYKTVFREVLLNSSLPVVLNVNFGHAYPRCVLPLGEEVELDLEKKTIRIVEKILE